MQLCRRTRLAGVAQVAVLDGPRDVAVVAGAGWYISQVGTSAAVRQAAPEAADPGDRDGADLRLRDALESLKRFAPQRG